MSRTPVPAAPARRRLLAGLLSTVLVASGLALLSAAPTAAEVPDPQPGTTQIVVKTGGERDAGSGAVDGLAGVVLELWQRNSPRNQLATCISDADGDCVFVVDSDKLSNSASNNDFWVVQADSFADGSEADDDYYANDEFVVSDGGYGNDFDTEDYRIAVDNVKLNDTTVVGATGSGGTATSGVWQDSYANPDALAQCGLDIALVSDLSYSVRQSNSLGDLKAAAKGFVDALDGTPSTISLYTFGSTAPASGMSDLLDQSTLNSSHLTALRSAIDGYSIPNLNDDVYTNWDAAFRQLFGTGYDQVVMITDGNPTRHGPNSDVEGSGGTTSFAHLEQAIFSANTLKAEGTRIVAVGVGDDFDDGQNLRAISGTQEGEDFFISGWSELSQTLKELAQENCAGTVTVVKKVVPWNETDISEAAPASGWTFDAPTVSTGTVSPSTAQTTKHNPGQGDHGTINYKLEDIPAGATFTTGEQQQTGYTHLPQGGDNAVCTKNGSTPVDVDNVGALGFSVPVGKSDIVTCVVYNKEPAPRASLEVDKTWIVNGVEYVDGSQVPSSLSAQLVLGGTDQEWGDPRDLVAGSTTTVAEKLGSGIPELCEVVSQVLTLPGDGTVSVDLSGGAYTTPALPAGDTRYLVTNTVECGSELVLVKKVDNDHGGTATADDWKLSYTGGPAGGVASGTVNDVAPGSYTIAEIGQAGTDGYAPRSEDPIVCDGGALDGDTVSVPIATRVTCTFFNEDIAPQLRLKKIVSGGVVDADAWTLTAKNGGDTVLSGDGVVDYTQVDAGVAYTLSESTDHPGGDEFTGAWVCTVTDGPGASSTVVLGGSDAAPTVTLAVGQNVECIVTNTHQPSAPQIEKKAVGAVADAAAGTWDVTYTVTVTNPSAVLDLDYTLVDTPELPAGVTGVAAEYQVDGGASVPVTWTGGTISLTPSAATIAAGADPVVYTVTLTLAVGADAAEQAEACGTVETGIAIDNTATLTPVGGTPISSDDCAVIDLPEVDYGKSVTSVSQLADGDWRIEYEVEVSATGSGVARYDLTDVPAFGAGIAIQTATATASPAGQTLVGDWNGGVGATPATTLAADRAIAAGETHRYTVTIVATVGAGVIGTDAADCVVDEQTEDGTGFLNRALLTAGGADREPREACATPVAPEFEKDLVGTPVANGDGTVTILYELTITNPGDATLAYDLNDTLGFAAGVDVLNAEVTGAPDGVTLAAPAWNGETETLVASGVLLAPGEHVYEITVLAEPTLLVEKGDLECVEGTAGHGYFNGALLTSGSDEYVDDACAPIPESDLPTLPLPPEEPDLPTLSLTGVGGLGAALLALLLLLAGAAGVALSTRRGTGAHRA